MSPWLRLGKYFAYYLDYPLHAFEYIHYIILSLSHSVLINLFIAGMDYIDKFNTWLSVYGIGEEEEEQDVPETGRKFLYRKEKRLTTAITVTHLLAYLRGESIDSYENFLSSYNFRHDPDVLDKCRNYQRWLYKKFRRCNAKLDLRLDGVKATIERAYDLQYTFWTKQRPEYSLTWLRDNHQDC